MRKPEQSWGVIGIDLSMSSISGCMMGYDRTLRKTKNAAIHSVRWERNVHYFERLAFVAKAQDFIHDLMIAGRFHTLPAQQIFIGVEEPWPMGMVKKMESGWLKQQAEINGAFLGGLIRYGYVNIFQVNNQSWKNIIREDEGIRAPDKWDVKRWAISAYGLPDRPDLIAHGTRGLIPRPKESKAKAKQPDDVYDACGIMDWMRTEMEKGQWHLKPRPVKR